MYLFIHRYEGSCYIETVFTIQTQLLKAQQW